MSISRDEWLSALHDAGYHDEEHDASAVTAAEFAAMFGVPLGTATHRLKALVASGRAVATRKWGTTTYGRRVQYVAYRLPAEAKKRR